MISVESISALTVDYATDMERLAKEAQGFLAAHGWCRGVGQGFLVWGFPKLALFLFDAKVDEQSEKLWVVVGDMPPAYLDFGICPNAYEALQGYVGEFMAWVTAVRRGEPVEDLVPVYVRGTFDRRPPTLDVAEDLERRLLFIKDRILPEYEIELRENRYRTDD
jgi:hypothetical protein